MKNTKYVFGVYSAWDYAREIEDLNKMSGKGWQLVKGGLLANKYKKNDNVQDAHEAIRPTSVLREPAKIKQYLSGDEFKLKMDTLYQKTINESRKLRNAVGGMRGAAARLAAVEEAARNIFGF